MKTRKIYKKPKCKPIRLDTEDLCDFFNPGSEAGDVGAGAKRNQFIVDDSGDESQESEIQ